MLTAGERARLALKMGQLLLGRLGPRHLTCGHLRVSVPDGWHRLVEGSVYCHFLLRSRLPRMFRSAWKGARVSALYLCGLKDITGLHMYEQQIKAKQSRVIGSATPYKK